MFELTLLCCVNALLSVCRKFEVSAFYRQEICAAGKETLTLYDVIDLELSFFSSTSIVQSTCPVYDIAKRLLLSFDIETNQRPATNIYYPNIEKYKMRFSQTYGQFKQMSRLSKRS